MGSQIMSSTVLFVSYTGQISGAETMMLDVVGEAQRAGMRTVVACPSGPLAEALPHGCTHVPIPELSLGGATGVARGIAAARLLGRWISAAATLRPLARVPGTATVVNSVFALPALRLARPPDGIAWLVHDAMTNGQQRMVITASRAVVRIAVACTQAAAAPVRELGIEVRVVPYGVRVTAARPPGPALAPPVVGMLALVTPWKGHQVALEACSRLGDVVLEFAGGSFPGDAGYVADLQERAGRPDLAGRVRFLGHVDPGSVMARWDVMVSASVSPEAGPLSVLEAMSCGLPVIATDHGGPTEFLRDGVGVLVPPGDPDALAAAIKSVLADDILRRRMSARGRERIAAEHDIAVTLPALLGALTGGPRG
ncbi:glycosyltransferase family 4 protein [soil metagenome]